MFIFLHVFPMLGMEILETVQNRKGPWFLILRAPFKEDEPLNPVVHKHPDSGLFRPVVGGSPGCLPLPSLQRSPALPPGRRGHGGRSQPPARGASGPGSPGLPRAQPVSRRVGPTPKHHASPTASLCRRARRGNEAADRLGVCTRLYTPHPSRPGLESA